MCRNDKGYETAEQLSAKFTHVSPVWLQLRWDTAAAAFSVAGQQDIDAGWMARVAQPKFKARSCIYKCLLEMLLFVHPSEYCWYASLHSQC